MKKKKKEKQENDSKGQRQNIRWWKLGLGLEWSSSAQYINTPFLSDISTVSLTLPLAHSLTPKIKHQRERWPSKPSSWSSL